MLIEIHILQNHAPSNLNRDDSGSPKTATFGDFKRARISSQCLKRSIRCSPIFKDAVQTLATRSRRLPERIRDRFRNDSALKIYADVAAKLATGLGNKEGTQSEPNKKTGEYETKQSVFFTQADEDRIFEVLKAEALKAGSEEKLKKVTSKEVQKAAAQRGFRPLEIDVALFGRMITSEAFRDVEATTQVAHAISTNKVSPEFDYFTAMDDLMRADSSVEEDAGADIIGDVEFNSACYYKYFSIHPDALVDNLTGEGFELEEIPSKNETQSHQITKAERDQKIDSAASAISEFLRAAVMVSPTGKQNSFAAHQLPFAILVEVRPNSQPISYANAFVLPVKPMGDMSLPHASFEKLKTHAQALTKKFGLKSQARWLLTEADDLSIEGVQTMDSLDELCGLLQEQVATLKKEEASLDV